MSLPNEDERLHILEILTNKMNGKATLHFNVNLKELAYLTENCSSAVLESFVNSAVAHSLRRPFLLYDQTKTVYKESYKITMEDFSLAFYEHRDEYIQSPRMAIMAKGFGTCIVAFLVPNRREIIIGSDSLTTRYLCNGEKATDFRIPKIFMIGTRVIMGICGSVDFATGLVDRLRSVGYGIDVTIFSILRQIHWGIQCFKTEYLNSLYNVGPVREDFVLKFNAVIGIVELESSLRVPFLSLYDVSDVNPRGIRDFVAIGTGRRFAEIDLSVGYEKVSSTEDAVELCMRSLCRANLRENGPSINDDASFPVYRFRCPASGSTRSRLQGFFATIFQFKLFYLDIYFDDDNPDASKILVQTVEARNIRRQRAIGIRIPSDCLANAFPRLLYPMIEASISIEDEL